MAWLSESTARNQLLYKWFRMTIVIERPVVVYDLKHCQRSDHESIKILF